MRNAIKRIFFIVCLGVFSSASAQLYLPDGLSADEQKVFEVLGLKDPAYRSHLSKTLQFEVTKEQFRRAALLAKCRALSREGTDKYHFDSALRNAMMSVVNKIAIGQLNAPSLAMFRWEHRAILWAWSVTPAQERRDLMGLLESSKGRQLLQQLFLVRAAANYQHYSYDVSSGVPQPAAPVLIKSYFKAAGQLPLLEAVVMEHLPESQKEFRELKELENYTVADIPMLMPLANGFQRIESEFKDHIFETFSLEDQQALRKILGNTFWRSHREALGATFLEREQEYRSAMNKQAFADAKENTSTDAAKRAIDEAINKLEGEQKPVSNGHPTGQIENLAKPSTAAEAVAQAAAAAKAVSDAIKAVEEAVNQANQVAQGNSTRESEPIGKPVTPMAREITQKQKQMLGDINTRFPKPKDYELYLGRTPAQTVDNEYLPFCSK